MIDALGEWKDFNVAMAGATAALAGLVIVAASVNIAEIVHEKSLTSRLASGIAGLVLAISVSAVGLIPELTLSAYGTTTIVLGLIASIFAVDAAWRIQQDRRPQNRLRPVKGAMGFAAPGAYVVAGILLITGNAAGLVAVAVGSIAAIWAGLLVSWIVLVEVLR